MFDAEFGQRDNPFWGILGVFLLISIYEDESLIFLQQASTFIHPIQKLPK